MGKESVFNWKIWVKGIDSLLEEKEKNVNETQTYCDMIRVSFSFNSNQKSTENNLIIVIKDKDKKLATLQNVYCLRNEIDTQEHWTSFSFYILQYEHHALVLKKNSCFYHTHIPFVKYNRCVQKKYCTRSQTFLFFLI